MKNRKSITIFISTTILFFFISDCKKDKEEDQAPACCCPPYSDIFGMYLHVHHPVNGSAVNSNTPTIAWGSDVSANRYRRTYDVYLGTSPHDLRMISSGQTQDTIILSGLDMNLTYYWQVKAHYKWQDYYNNDVTCSHETSSAVSSFITFQSTDLPTVITAPVLKHTNTPPRVGGNILNTGTSEILERGVYFSLLPDAVLNGKKFQIGNRPGLFSDLLPDLNTSTTYYVKAYATNSSGTSYGSEVSFATGENTKYKTVRDVDGNVYYTIDIGSQVWMAENLRTTKYNDGTDISLDFSTPENVLSPTPLYRWYNNDIGYMTTYGALYSTVTVSGNKNVCPVGWHVPSYSDWNTLITNVGGKASAGGNLKETSSFFWKSPNVESFNSNDFSALPGGYGGPDYFKNSGSEGYWFSIGADNDPTRISYLIMRNSEISVFFDLGTTSNIAFSSVRCIKD
jgi:uncharacterized protein (TIGR02145 family)